MPTHDNKDDGKDYGHRLWDQPERHGPEEIDTSAGYEQTDVKVTGIVVFLASLFIFVAVTGVLCYGIGKVINSELNREDGPDSKWTQTADIRQLGNLPSDPAMQNKVAALAQTFPSPRLQTDDGYQEIADLHAKEDLLLENYTWADQSQGSPRRVRIPIERAMELIVQENRLQTAPQVEKAQPMAGDNEAGVTAPLTNGFARTGYEQELEQSEVIEGARGKHQ